MSEVSRWKDSLASSKAVRKESRNEQTSHTKMAQPTPYAAMLPGSPEGKAEPQLTRPDSCIRASAVSGQVLMPAGYKMPVIDIDPGKCHNQPEVDFSIEANPCT